MPRPKRSGPTAGAASVNSADEADERQTLVAADAERSDGAAAAPVPAAPVPAAPAAGDAESGGVKAAGAPAYPFCHPRRHYRWALLAFICLLTFGSYFSYDNPAALENMMVLPFSQGGLNMTMIEIQALYSMYSWPNTVLSFVGGILIDRVLGMRLGAIIFSGLCLLGQAIVSIGAQFNSFATMMAGRFVFGLGGENLAVAQNAFAVKWFKGKELNMVFGLGLSISRVGSTVNMNIELPIAQSLGLSVAFWIGTILCAMSVTDAIVLSLLDRRGTRLLDAPVKPASKEKISLRYILRFPLSLWIIFLICVFFYVSIFPFITIAPSYFVTKWPQYKDQANAMASLPYLISGFASPVFGFVVDRTGYNPIWVLIATACVSFSHLLLTFTDVVPWVSMSIVGVAYSVCACGLWPMVGYLVAEEHVGTAYGLMQSVQNLGLAVVPLVIGNLVGTDNNFTNAMYFIDSCVLCSILLTVWLVLNDVRSVQRRLMMSRVKLAALRLAQVESLIKEDPDAAEAIPVLVKSPTTVRNYYLARLGIYADRGIGLPK